MQKKLLLVRNLTVWNVWIVLLYSFFNYTVKFVNTDFKKYIVNFVALYDIAQIDVSSIDKLVWSEYALINTELINAVYKKSRLNNFYDKNSHAMKQYFLKEKYFSYIAKSKIASMLKNLDILIFYSTKLSHKFDKIKILSFRWLLIAEYLTEINKNKSVEFVGTLLYRPIQFTFIFLIFLIHRLLLLVSLFSNSILFSYRNKEIFNFFSKTASQYLIAYFPHQGMSYGSLYQKEQYYHSDIDHPLNKSNLLHLEYNLEGDNASFFRSEYESVKAPYYFFGKIIFIDYIFVNKFICLNHNPFAFLIALKSAVDIHRYERCLAKFNNFKSVIVGYDLLFPVSLNIALKKKKVKICAAQERRNLLYSPDMQKMIFDKYLVWSEGDKSFLVENDIGEISSIEISPCWRVEYFLLPRLKCKKIIKQNVRQALKIDASYSLIAACFDYHSEPDTVQKLNPLVNWRNNTVFYLDVIRLAEKYPQVFFIIRGKDNAWTTLPYFQEIVSTIKKADNIKIDMDYETATHSYNLAVSADIIVAKYTSIGDECLALNIPVIYHDYGQNHQGWFKYILPTTNAGCFAENFLELDAFFNRRYFELSNNTTFTDKIDYDEKNFISFSKKFYEMIIQEDAEKNGSFL